ncbi:NAD(+)/NADH kinase [Proteinivorax hydrogeniformans]|uniref:NAD kinase n=1 Tax=Proteinivorax hydrogeniformans TaxID=1826727 RepID=A0AAU8HQG0_9FIRM
MKNIAIFLNPSKESSGKVSTDIVASLKEKGYEVFSCEETPIKDTIVFPSVNLPENIELILVLGGDGTFLSIARKYATHKIPMLGVNLGHLGFLTEVEVKDLKDTILKINEGKYTIENRDMVVAKVYRDGKVIEKTRALNEITIAKGPLARIIQCSTYVDDVFLETYSGDGVIVSTPTGSTGYSLSAGGPIIAPNVSSMVISPICPHSLHSRSVVVSNNSQVKIKLNDINQEVMLTVDGQKSIKLHAYDTVVIELSDYVIPVVKIQGKNFFDILRLKLNRGTRK